MSGNITGLTLNEGELSYLAQRFATNQVTALAIMRAESGGVTDIVRDESRNPSGGNDRGLWQFNDKAFPDISDVTAFGPIASTIEAQRVSNGGADFGPWAVGPNSYRGEPRTDLDLNTATAILARNAGAEASVRMLELEKALGNASSTGVLDLVTNPGDALDLAAGAIGNPFSSLVGFLGKALALLTSAEFWRRTGLVVAGVVVIIVALVVIFRDTATAAAATAIGGPAAGAVVSSAT